MSSSVLSFFYGPVFTLHMTNYMDICLCFLISIPTLHPHISSSLPSCGAQKSENSP